MMTSLEEMVTTTRREAGAKQARIRLVDLKVASAAQPAALDIVAALGGPVLHVIAEIKRASPSKGDLNADVNPAALARTYVAAGAAAISVLTSRFFKGSLDDLRVVKTALRDAGCPVPLLRKDFIVDPYQVWEARGYGADAILLIAAILPPAKLADLFALSHSLGMECLVEVHDLQDLEKAAQVGARLIGINNRDLQTFAVDVETTRRLLPHVPAGATIVSESGLLGCREVELVQSWGVDAVLVGEALMTAPDPAAKLQELRSAAGIAE